MNPVLELGVNFVGLGSHISQSLEDPVSNLSKAESKYRFLDLDGLFHLLDILRLFSWFLVLSRLLGILTFSGRRTFFV